MASRSECNKGLCAYLARARMMSAGVSVSFEVDVCIEKVGGYLITDEMRAGRPELSKNGSPRDAFSGILGLPTLTIHIVSKYCFSLQCNI